MPILEREKFVLLQGYRKEYGIGQKNKVKHLRFTLLVGLYYGDTYLNGESASFAMTL